MTNMINMNNNLEKNQPNKSPCYHIYRPEIFEFRFIVIIFDLGKNPDSLTNTMLLFSLA